MLVFAKLFGMKHPLENYASLPAISSPFQPLPIHTRNGSSKNTIDGLTGGMSLPIGFGQTSQWPLRKLEKNSAQSRQNAKNKKWLIRNFMMNLNSDVSFGDHPRFCCSWLKLNGNVPSSIHQPCAAVVQRMFCGSLLQEIEHRYKKRW